MLVAVAGRVGNLGSMVYHGERGIEMNVCVSLLVINRSFGNVSHVVIRVVIRVE